MSECKVPPPGWSCSRGAGHDGPCAASPTTEAESIPGNARDTLLCLWIHGPTWDGNVPSKAGRDWLVDQKLAVRGDGWQWLTESGGRLCIRLGMGPEKDRWEAKQRKYRQEREEQGSPPRTIVICQSGSSPEPRGKEPPHCPSCNCGEHILGPPETKDEQR